MKRVGIAAAATAASLALVLAGCGLVEEDGGSGGSDSIDGMKSMTLNINGIGAPGDQNMRALEAFAKEVEEGTDGKLTFDIYEPNALLTTPEALKGVGAGVADIAVIVGAAHPNELPITVWLSALAAKVDNAFPAGTLQGGAAINELFRTNEEIQAEYEAQGVHVLNSNMYGQQYDLLCHEPITDLASVKGVRTRSPGPVWTKLVERIGMEPTQFTSADTYEALQRKVIDCEISPPEAHVTVGGMDIAREYTPVPFTGNLGGYTLTINQDVWESLPAEAQDVVNKAAATHWATLSQGQVEAPMSFVENAEKYKTNFNTPSADLIAAVVKAQEQAIAEMVDEAPKGISDPEAVIAQFDELAQKWLASVPEEAFINRDEPVSPDTYRTAAELDFSAFYAEVEDSFTK